MSDSHEGERLPANFSGRVRLFPLPNLVMFPHVVQPLHIFEPRYLAMLEDCLAKDRLLAMALLQPGWEAHYEDRPPIHPVVCVGRVISHSLTEDGRYNLLLQGLRRATVIKEQPGGESFRVAEVAILEDLYPASGGARRTRLRSELLQCFRELLPETVAGAEQFEAIYDEHLTLGALVDIVAYSLELELVCKQQLLAEWNVDLRAVMLLDQLRRFAQGGQPAGSPFPPGFSEN